MATQHSKSEKATAAVPVGVATREEEKQAREEAEEATEKAKKEVPKPQAQIDAERALEGEDVPEEEQGKPTDARAWTALERERQERSDTEKFKTELSRKFSERERELAEKNK